MDRQGLRAEMGRDRTQQERDQPPEETRVLGLQGEWKEVSGYSDPP